MRSLPRLLRLLRFREQQVRAAEQNVARAKGRLLESEARKSALVEEWEQQVAHAGRRRTRDTTLLMPTQISLFRDWIRARIEQCEQVCRQHTEEHAGAVAELSAAHVEREMIRKLANRTAAEDKKQRLATAQDQVNEHILNKWSTATNS